MALYFPPEYKDSNYFRLYRQLPVTDRLMLQREFVGVSYLRRFYLLQQRQAAAAFRAEQLEAGRFLHRKLTIGRLLWRRKDLVRLHLELILRHYLFGFLVQLAGRKRELSLPAPEPGCYWNTAVNLTVLVWLNRHRGLWQPELTVVVERMVAGSIRHFFIYCLEALLLARRLYRRPALAAARDSALAVRAPGRMPLGVEMEFSNLGRWAVERRLSDELIARDPFRNMELYSDFHLEDVTWRLGGYVDTHEHGRRIFSLRRYGGFFEYSLVRVDYPRQYTLPLTRDCEIAARMIYESIDFIPEIHPHSLHLNIENCFPGEFEPGLEDFICLLLLGGDFSRDGPGRLRERRLAEREIHRFIKLRRHLSLLTGRKQEVVEYAFLRLHPKGMSAAVVDYAFLITVLKGFQNRFRLARELCLERLPALFDWAENPRPLGREAITRFVRQVSAGLAREAVMGPQALADFESRLETVLGDCQRRIFSSSSSPVPAMDFSKPS